jgi:hypothetical protein
MIEKAYQFLHDVFYRVFCILYFFFFSKKPYCNLCDELLVMSSAYRYA